MSDPRAPYVVEDLPSFEPGPEQPDPNPLRSRCIQAQDAMIAILEAADRPGLWESAAGKLESLNEWLQWMGSGRRAA